MMNMLIVDDEPLVLLTIRSLCRWEDFGIRIAGEAENGKAALDFIGSNPDIDIVVVDVDMPVMNGLEFAEALQKQNPDPAVIFLSSYSNFEYVRSAFKSGAYEYILKSELDEHSLLNAIRAIPGIQFQKQKNRDARNGDSTENIRAAFFAALIGDSQEDPESLFTLSGFTVTWPFYFMILRPGDLLMVHQRYENKLYDFQKTMSDLLRRFVPASLGASGALSYDQYYIFMQTQEQLDNAFELFYRAAWTYSDTGFERKTGGAVEDIAGLKREFTQCLKGFLPPSRLVIRSRRYIREHFSNPALTLQDIASYNNVSKNYLSSEFTRETGETISGFITRMRIREAEKLLRETNLRVYEIAEKAGYLNVETFNRAFKRVTGKNPGAYI
ncbi:MAG: response regulator [Treponema sp.]|jgi:two-component system response regulator YesN|nr:response regulator [Treponema sp.]